MGQLFYLATELLFAAVHFGAATVFAKLPLHFEHSRYARVNSPYRTLSSLLTVLFGGYLFGGAMLVDAFKADRFYDAWVRLVDRSGTSSASKPSSLARTSSRSLPLALSSSTATALRQPSSNTARRRS